MGLAERLRTFLTQGQRRSGVGECVSCGASLDATESHCPNCGGARQEATDHVPVYWELD